MSRLPNLIYESPCYYTLMQKYKGDSIKADHDYRLLNRRMLRTSLSEAQNHICCYCNRRMDERPDRFDSITIEHIIPRVHGGTDSYYNLVVCCAYCNSCRGDQYIEEEEIVREFLGENL